MKAFDEQLLRKVRPHKRKENARVNTRHDEFIRSLPCAICGAHPVDLSHLRIGTDGGTGLRPSSHFALPLCHIHHMESHTGERSFWEKYKTDPHDLASHLSMISPDVELAKAHLATVRLRIQERSFRR